MNGCAQRSRARPPRCLERRLALAPRACAPQRVGCDRIESSGNHPEATRKATSRRVSRSRSLIEVPHAE
ncbi:hypothetical protein DO72_5693 [Burkholderia pseudomallei]|nr:hypothetical protein DO72_5693 [Burkholderia pseudomallei]